MSTLIYWHPALFSAVIRVLGALPVRHLVTSLAGAPIPNPLFPLSLAATGGGGDASTITQFFKNLYDNGIKPVAYAVALFFFA